MKRRITIEIDTESETRCENCDLVEGYHYRDGRYCLAFQSDGGAPDLEERDGALLRCSQCIASDVTDDDGPIPDTVRAPGCAPAEPEPQDDDEILVEFDGVEMQPARDDGEAPYVCPGCHAVGAERCAPGCIDAEIEADHRHAIETGDYDRCEEDEE